MEKAEIGIIGGSGFHDILGLQDREEIDIVTPFGRPSSQVLLGELSGKKVAFISRHGTGHRTSPSNVNYRGNIAALKLLGVKAVLAVSAVGSLRFPGVEQEDLVFTDQLIDLTKRRESTFFDEYMVVHVSIAKPVCSFLSGHFYVRAKRLGFRAHASGTNVCIEGPHYSTVAESKLYRSWGADVVGMTNATEAKLAREAQLCFAIINHVTDLDCCIEEAPVTTAEIMSRLKNNVEKINKVIVSALETLDVDSYPCKCRYALEDAIASDMSYWKDFPPFVGVREKFSFLVPSL